MENVHMSCNCRKRATFQTKGAPEAIGPYSPGVRAGHFVYTAGQAGMDPATGNLVEGGIEAETRQALNNIKAILEAGGTTMDRVVKTTVFLRDMGDFTRMNAVYAGFFPSDPPARTTVQAARLPRDCAVEIDAIALLPEEDCDCG
jgi:2-iminobutanoate/2-iminopropanoate deaminase